MYTEPTHDTGTAVAKARDTAISLAEGRLVVDMADKIFLLDANITPLAAFLTNIGKDYNGKTWQGSGILKVETGNPKFSWLEDYESGRYAKVSGTYVTAVGVTITITGAGTQSAYIFTPGDIILNARTGERMKVATVPTATTITIATAGRSYGATAAAAGVDGDGLYIVGNVSEEGATVRNVNMTRSAEVFNYTLSMIWV